MLELGMNVSATNPELADWRGVIETSPDGRWRDVLDDNGNPDIYIYVNFHTGTSDTEGCQPKKGWYALSGLKPS